MSDPKCDTCPMKEMKIPYADFGTVIGAIFLAKTWDWPIIPTVLGSLAISIPIFHTLKVQNSLVHDTAMNALGIDME